MVKQQSHITDALVASQQTCDQELRHFIITMTGQGIRLKHFKMFFTLDIEHHTYILTYLTPYLFSHLIQTFLTEPF